MSLPLPKGEVANALGHLLTQSGLLCSCCAWCWWGRRAGALARSGLLARVPEVGALCFVGEDTEAGRDGAGLPRGQANPENPVFLAQPFSPFPPQCYSTLARRHSPEWPFNWKATCGFCLKNPKDEGK